MESTLHLVLRLLGVDAASHTATARRRAGLREGAHETDQQPLFAAGSLRISSRCPPTTCRRSRRLF
eukprot:11048914-Heterocapsa_arctica.AAC.1